METGMTCGVVFSFSTGFFGSLFWAHFPTVVGERTPLFPLLLVSFCPTQKRLPIFRVEIHRNEVRTFMSFMAATGSSPEQSSVRRWQRLGKLECAVARLSWIFKVRRRGCCRLGRVGPEKIFPVSQRGPLGILAYPLIYLPLWWYEFLAKFGSWGMILMRRCFDISSCKIWHFYKNHMIR